MFHIYERHHSVTAITLENRFQPPEVKRWPLDRRYGPLTSATAGIFVLQVAGCIHVGLRVQV